MLHSYFFNRQKFNFVKSFPKNVSKNTFTIIVGKNGTGKSTLLRSIVVDFLRENIAPSTLKSGWDLSTEDRENRLGTLSYNNMPTKIICVSTSPFDKFPTLKRNQDSAYYSYLGLRGLPSHSLAPAYMARIIYTLIGAAQESSAHASAIATVLEYLDYEPELQVFSSLPSAKVVDAILSDGEGERSAMNDYLDRGHFAPAEANFLLRQLADIDAKTYEQIRRAVQRLLYGNRRGQIVSVLGRNSSGSRTHPEILPDDLLLLSRFGIVKLKDVILKKRTRDEPLRMSDMSSGEQSVVMGLLGIASQLQDGSLICVDEPEVCLHPEWQERYIKLLSSIFSHYRACHFIIATHSPQIVAQLPEDRCYVMDMKNGIALSSTQFCNRSVDYQLAALFNAPGFKNEYLSRIALNIFIRVAKEKSFASDLMVEYRLLNEAYPLLRADDPIREVIESIQEMRKVYV